MSTLTFSIKIEGDPTAADLLGIWRQVQTENNRIDKANQEAAAFVAAENRRITEENLLREAHEQIPLLPEAEILPPKTYEVILAEAVRGFHLAAVQQAREASELTYEQRLELQTAINLKLTEGHKSADILNAMISTITNL